MLTESIFLLTDRALLLTQRALSLTEMAILMTIRSLLVIEGTFHHDNKNDVSVLIGGSVKEN